MPYLFEGGAVSDGENLPFTVPPQVPTAPPPPTTIAGGLDPAIATAIGAQPPVVPSVPDPTTIAGGLDPAIATAIPTQGTGAIHPQEDVPPEQQPPGTYGVPFGSDDPAFDGFVFEPFYGSGGGLSEDAANAKILRGMNWVNSVKKHSSARAIDVKAAVANAMAEGLQGLIGDQGHAYGPWQIWAEDGRIAAFAGLPLYAPNVQAWSWTDNGIDYAIRSMVSGGAAHLTGHAAVAKIVRGFEQPANIPGAIVIRNNNYDHLVSLGNQWDDYTAKLANGPQIQGVGATPPTGGAVPVPPDTKPSTVGKLNDATLSNAWRDFLGVFKDDIPFAHDHTEKIAKGLIKVVK